MSSHELLRHVKKFVPPLLDSFHKGQHGRVAVIGGSEEYSGAPFFSANASALLGADLSHVICEPQAAQVIKTYSPNLIVHPFMRQSNCGEPTTADQVAERMAGMLDRLHALVVGPGLGRDKLMQESARKIIVEAKKRRLPIVVDADGLCLVQKDPFIVHGYIQAVLTPNVMEFGRLCCAQSIDTTGEDPSQMCCKLAESLGGVTIIQKGPKDYISNGTQTIICDVQGGLKRSSGQGDTLTGTLATFLAWKIAYQARLWEHDNSLSDTELIILSAYGAAAITRTCSRLAFEKMKRSVQASDLSSEVPTAFDILLG
ncbi:Ribokinase-like protein [Wilcoxina mikolae CBS 423.85]|nr:Ribokinase-like protein [Wilcoxina mikolae CBS 423.85]